MSLEHIIANYIAQQHSLGKRYSAEVTILAAFRLSVSDVRLRDIRPEMISRFVERGGTSDETRSKKFRVLSGLFRFAVTRHHLKTSPMPRCPRKRTHSSYVPYIYSEAELKRLLAAVPAATANSRYVIDADTLRALLLLLYGAGLRRGEALRLKIKDVDISQSLVHIRGTKFFKTRIVPLSDSLNTVIRTFVARQGTHYSAGGESRLFSSSDGAALSDTTLGVTFRRLRTIANIREKGRRARPASNARPQAFGRCSPCHRVVSLRR